MKFGFIPTEGGHYFNECLEETLLGEELGFDSVWLEEHHSVRNHYWPSPMMALSGLATRTKKVLLGTDVMVLPFYHPVRLAEDSCLLDLISNGRFIFGGAIGYKPDEFALYQAPLENRGARFEEAIRLIMQLWTQDEVNFDGKYFQVTGARIEPRPLSQPHPPVWLGGWGDLSLRRAAELGDAWVPGPTANLEKLLDSQKTYHRYLSTFGINPKSLPSPLTREVVIAETDQKAWEIAQKHLLINYRDEYGGGQWKHPLIGSEDSTPVSEMESISRNRFIIGNPDTIIKTIHHFIETFGVDHLICRLYFAGMSHTIIMDELKLFAKEVFPAFDR